MDIEKSIDIEFSKMLDFLKEIIQIDSQETKEELNCPFGKGPAMVLNKTLNYCENLGFRTKNLDNYIGWAEYGSGDDMIGIPIHLDVVPEGSGWTYEPFGATINNDILYGRGVCDNKGPVAIMIHVLSLIKEEYPNWTKRVRLIFGTNEETGMKCIEYYKNKHEELPTYGFTPDAMYPIVTGEKGRLHVKISKKTKENNLIIDGGSNANIVPSKCSIEFLDEKFILNENGKSAHGSTPEKGINAITKCLDKIDKKVLYKYDDLNKILNLFNNDYNGLKLGIDSCDEIFGNTTVNLGVLNTIENMIYLELDIRFGKSITFEEIIDTLHDVFNEWNVEIIHKKDIHYINDSEYIVKSLKHVFTKVTGLESTSIVMGGGTYASCFEHMVAFGPKFMNIKTGGHAPDEHISLLDLKNNMIIYTNTMLYLLGLEGERAL